ncbi:putative c6 zinc finger domain-containing protein [Botrytis fragariae]|uniref:Putative c6 zinc finger domain-containing protein n=1 Tax=Botrytis fragariae TaxID=1964551 RepID=A0A8H6AZ44_9HELO|nr:putative c6 zinc finger domain-containing protein [Botrytis fragariae]KAF5876261.1 putative c6 zinc finger domain-containing protein [Botrytis fragariae]
MFTNTMPVVLHALDAMCANRGCDCVYTPSKRGGARRRKKNTNSEGRIEQSPPNELLTGPAPVVSLATPGAGLLQRDEQLDFDMDFAFDSNMQGNQEPLSMNDGFLSQNVLDDTFQMEKETPVVRTYANDEDILSAYYVYIHPYFPVLPPPLINQAVDKLETGVQGPNDILFHSRSNPQFQSASPMTLAISALLALIPHPDDPSPTSPESIILRRNQAQVFAQLAIDGVEIENEMIESIVDPGEALSAQEMQIYRSQIHSQVRLEAESTIALLLLCTYEYSQRGNISKMRKRCGQALVSAMDLGLHSKDKVDYAYAESDRRVWWMTVCTSAFAKALYLVAWYVFLSKRSFLHVLTKAIKAPSILLSDPRFTTPLPTFGSDSDAWDVFLEAQRVIATATQFVIDLESSLKSESHDLKLWEAMAGLEKTIEPLVQNAEKWSYGNVDYMEPSESVVAKSLRLMTRIKLNSARIKIHRYCAFSDMPVFTKKHCDLSSTTPSVGQNPGTACGCSNNLQQATATLTLSPGILNSPLPDDSSVFDSPILPFSGRFSSKVCMQSAFNIAQSFRALPFPRPSDPRNTSYWNSTIQTNLPRMMPIFACCSMQASYSMIMLCHKTLAIKQATSFEDGLRRRTDKLLFQLHEGIKMILDALENYSTANEALKGMRDQIRMAMDSVAAVQ